MGPADQLEEYNSWQDSQRAAEVELGLASSAAIIVAEAGTQQLKQHMSAEPIVVVQHSSTSARLIDSDCDDSDSTWKSDAMRVPPVASDDKQTSSSATRTTLHRQAVLVLLVDSARDLPVSV